MSGIWSGDFTRDQKKQKGYVLIIFTMSRLWKCFP